MATVTHKIPKYNCIIYDTFWFMAVTNFPSVKSILVQWTSLIYCCDIYYILAGLVVHIVCSFTKTHRFTILSSSPALITYFPMCGPFYIRCNSFLVLALTQTGFNPPFQVLNHCRTSQWNSFLYPPIFRVSFIFSAYTLVLIQLR